MNIDDMKLGDLKALVAAFSAQPEQPQSDKIGKYVIVRCRDAGVHAGELVSASGRGCSLKGARRLWYWKPANGAAFLSGVAVEGLDQASKVGVPVDTDLTENCEILLCSDKSAESIRGATSYEP